MNFGKKLTSRRDEGRAGLGAKEKHLDRWEEPRAPAQAGPGGHLSESRRIMFLRAFLRLVLLGDLTAGRSSGLCSSFRSSISMTTT